jgi:hypothetical protein|uniref:DUF1858 domain-containing protein n=1 Tax=candidate division WOR-3 bacterium TaxID=2052148 RepID=A0A7C3J6N7_UNCW3
MNKKVTLDMEVEDIVREYPQLISYLMDRDIICIRCGAPVWGSLRELLESKGIEDVENFVEQMNLFLEKES